jgi:hypothetical protein
MSEIMSMLALLTSRCLKLHFEEMVNCNFMFCSRWHPLLSDETTRVACRLSLLTSNNCAPYSAKGTMISASIVNNGVHLSVVLKTCNAANTEPVDFLAAIQ